MKKITNKLVGGMLLLSVSMSLTSCEDILGHWEKPVPVAPVEEGVYAFSLRNLADDADVAATALTVTDQDGTEIATVSSNGKYKINKDDLSASTELWLEATTANGNYIARAKVDEIAAIAQEGKLKMATLGNIIGADGKFYANKAAADAASTTGAAMIVYLGSGGEANTDYHHGLAIALKNATNAVNKFAWRSSSSSYSYDYTGLDLPKQYTTMCTGAETDAEKDMAGIDNTKTLKDKHAAYEAAVAADAYSVDGFTPETYGFSGWFLPSLGQWYKFMNGMCGLTWGGLNYNTTGLEADLIALNKGFVDAGYDTDETKFADNHYWSSTEYNAGGAIKINPSLFSGINISWDSKHESVQRYARAFLAF